MKWRLAMAAWLVTVLVASFMVGQSLRASLTKPPAAVSSDAYVLASSAASWRAATATVAGPVRQVLDTVINDPNGGWIVVGCTAWVEAGPHPYNHHVSVKVANSELDGACEKLHASIGAWVVMRARILGCCFTLGSPGCVPGCDRVDLQATAVEFGGRRRDR